jgi:hypothetical protein
MRHRSHRLAWLAVAVLSASTIPQRWPAALEERFLLAGRIVSEGGAGKGITGSKKATMSDGRRTHAVHIQFIDQYMPLFKGKDGSQEEGFKDTWKFNVAAWRLGKMLGLSDMMPACVARQVDGRPASVCWWLDGIMMDEKERLAKNIQPPDVPAWNRQMDTIRVFDQLIYNMDRSQENLLIASDWRAYMIDHTRAFRKWTTLRNPAAITHCSPELLRSLKALRREDVARELGEFLTPVEIDGLMARRDLIVAKLEKNGNPQDNGVELPARYTSRPAGKSKTSRR